MAYRALLLVHVVSVLALAIGDVGALFATARARRAASVPEVLTLMRFHRAIIRAQLVPGAIGSLVTGLALVHVVGMSLTMTWIAGTLVCWGASLALGLALLLPEEARAIRAAERLVEQNASAPDDALRDAVGSVRVVVGEWLTVILLLAMTALMVVKPT